MAKIVVDPQELSDTGSQWMTKRQEVDALIQQSRALANKLQGSWQGMRSTKFQNDYNEIEKGLKMAAETMQAASELLKRTSLDFSQADNAG